MATPWVNCSVKAHPGDFSVDMNTNILAEMTVTNHTAIYRFTFVQIPKEANATLSPLILADTIDLSLSRNNASVQVDDYTGRISGSGTFSSSVGIVNYNLHFCADFSSASIRDTGVFIDSRAGTEPKKNLSIVNDDVNTGSEILPAGGWVRFHAPE